MMSNLCKSKYAAQPRNAHFNGSRSVFVPGKNKFTSEAQGLCSPKVLHSVIVFLHANNIKGFNRNGFPEA